MVRGMLEGRASVENIAEQGVPDRSEVYADLVSARTVRTNLDQ